MKATEIQAIASAVADAVTNSLAGVISPKAPVVETEVTGQASVEYVTPTVKAYHDAEATLISKLAQGGNTRVIVGKRGARIVNEVEDSLNALHDIGRDRKIWSKNTTVR